MFLEIDADDNALTCIKVNLQDNLLNIYIEFAYMALFTEEAHSRMKNNNSHPQGNFVHVNSYLGINGC